MEEKHIKELKEILATITSCKAKMKVILDAEEERSSGMQDFDEAEELQNEIDELDLVNEDFADLIDSLTEIVDPSNEE